MIENEGWETLTAHDLHSRDPATVSRIQALLRSALGRSSQNGESREQNRAIFLLRKCTIGSILSICSTWLEMSIHNPAVTGLADQIFASHAWGAPFLNTESYKTWCESWDPQKKSFAGFARMTAVSRCKDWLDSPQSQNGPLERRDYPPEDEAGNTADMAYYRSLDDPPDSAAQWEQSLRRWQTCIDRLAPTYKAAMQALFDGYTAAEYAKLQSIEATTAQNHFNRGIEKIVESLEKEGIIDADFGNRRRLTQKDLIERLEKRLPDEMTYRKFHSYTFNNSSSLKKESEDDDTL